MSTNGEIKIEKGLPIPAGGHGRHSKYPWKEMEVGDSFAIPDTTRVASIRNAADQNGNRYSKKFSVRKTPDGYRCWRIA